VDRKECQSINDSRLAKWKAQMVDMHCTPLLLVGMGHDDRSGEMRVITLEEVSDEIIRYTLEAALRMLINGEHKRA
jgi:ERCC4-type nuclease